MPCKEKQVLGKNMVYLSADLPEVLADEIQNNFIEIQFWLVSDQAMCPGQVGNPAQHVFETL